MARSWQFGWWVLGLVWASAWSVAGATLPAAWVPIEQLSVTNRVLIEAVTADVTLQREYPPRQFRGQLTHFEFLLDHMLVTSTIAEHLGLIRYRVSRDDQGRYWADNREGAQGYLLPAYGANGVRIFYVAGARRGVFEARGRGVAAVHYRQPQAGRIEFSGAAFVKVDNRFLEILTELFRIFLRGTVDEHFEHILRQPVRLTEWADEDPVGLREKLKPLPPVDQALIAPFLELLPAASGNPHPPR